MNKISIRFSDLPDFEHISIGNKMPNLESQFIKLVGEDNLRKFLSNRTDSDYEEGLHILGTLILNAKRHIDGNWGSFGMHYCGVVCATYENCQSPCLLEFYNIKI